MHVQLVLEAYCGCPIVLKSDYQLTSIKWQDDWICHGDNPRFSMYSRETHILQFMQILLCHQKQCSYADHTNLHAPPSNIIQSSQDPYGYTCHVHIPLIFLPKH